MSLWFILNQKLHSMIVYNERFGVAFLGSTIVARHAAGSPRRQRKNAAFLHSLL